MNILINCSNLTVGGGIQVAHSFLNSIKNNKKDNFFIVLSDSLNCQISKLDFPSNFKFFQFKIPINFNLFRGNVLFLDDIVKKNSVCIVFSIFGPTYWRPKVRHVVGFAKPHYIYTNSPFFKIVSFKQKVLLRLKRFLHLRDFELNSDVLISENEDVSNKLKFLFPHKKVFTVSNFYNQIFDFPEIWDKDLSLPPFDGFTLLTISANYPHKNLSVILDVIRVLKFNNPEFKFRFVLTIERGDLSSALQEDIENYVIFLGKVQVNQVPHLYSQADAVFLPSLLECFSANYPEAMKMKIPIITSNLDFAKSICVNSALYFDPLDAEDIAKKILFLADNEILQFDLTEMGFKRLSAFDNYNSRANKYLEILENETNHTRP